MPGIFFLLVLALISAAVAWLAIPLASLLGRRMGAWDQPDELGIHKTATPRTGGIAIAVGLFIGAQAAWSQSLDTINGRLVVAAAVGSAMVFIVGLLDDLREIKPYAKALGLAAAAVAGQLIAPHAPITGFERLDFIIGVLILLFGANSVNLLDGMDGLASGLTAIMGLGFAAILYLDHRPLLTAQALILCGASLGFWVSNRPPARIFMGDCGSLMLGYILAGMALRASSYGPNQLLAAASILSLPILDTGLAVLRRLMSKSDVFTGDRRHVYDMLCRRHRSVWKVNGIMYLAAAAFAGWGVVSLYVHWTTALAVMLAGWSGLVGWMAWLGMFTKGQKA